MCSTSLCIGTTVDPTQMPQLLLALRLPDVFPLLRPGGCGRRRPGDAAVPGGPVAQRDGDAGPRRRRLGRGRREDHCRHHPQCSRRRCAGGPGHPPAHVERGPLGGTEPPSTDSIFIGTAPRRPSAEILPGVERPRRQAQRGPAVVPDRTPTGGGGGAGEDALGTHRDKMYTVGIGDILSRRTGSSLGVINPLTSKKNAGAATQPQARRRQPGGGRRPALAEGHMGRGRRPRRHRWTTKARLHSANLDAVVSYWDATAHHLAMSMRPGRTFDETVRNIMADVAALNEALQHSGRPSSLARPASPSAWFHVAMCFGATASVWHFNRTAHALQAAQRILLWIISSHFVDDFNGVDTDDVADSAFQGMADFLELLGLQTKPSKAQPPAPSQIVQGVLVTEPTAAAHSQQTRGPATSSCTQLTFGALGKAALQPIYARAHDAAAASATTTGRRRPSSMPTPFTSRGKHDTRRDTSRRRSTSSPAPGA